MGNEAVDQLKKFNQALADFSMAENPRLIDGILLTKFDTIDDKVSCIIIGSVRRQCGGVFRAPAGLKSGGRGFKSRSDHKLELFLGRPQFKSSVNSQHGLPSAIWDF